ncbi:hypothetical protein E2542_SST28572 [Spatholobus suberectus]|nr:hypothetical protein E2542_SST28572 [Spatholobus suberectus]
MNTTQVAARKPGIYAKNVSQLCRSFHSRPCTLPMGFDPLSVTSMSLGTKPSSGLQCLPILKSWQPLHVCLAGGQGMMENNEDSQRKSLEKAMEQFKGQSVEDILQKQMQKGGSGAKPPGGQGGGGSNGHGGPNGGSEDGSDETLQVVLATVCVIFLYILFTNGIELAKLARDCIRFLSGGGQSVRLKRAAYKWRRFYKNVTEKKKLSRMGWSKPPHGCSSLMSSEVPLLLRHYMKSKSDE